MTTKHTPGPWVIDNGTDTRENMADCEWVAVGIDDADGYAESVAYCHPMNAALIAEAPAMAEALRNAVQYADEGQGSLKAGNLADADFRLAQIQEQCLAILARIDGGAA